MYLHKSIEATLNGKKIKVDIQTYSRGGTKSPELDLILYKGKRYTPYAARYYGLYLTMQGLFQYVYSPHIANLIYKASPLLDLIQKDSIVGSHLYYQPVLLKP